MAMFIILGLVIGIYFLFRASPAKVNVPPGPRPFPFIGNLLQMPKEYPWKTFSKWSIIYGNLVYIEVFGSRFVVLNSAKAAKDLLVARSAIYSNRPHLVMAGDMIGYGKSLVLLQYGDAWLKQRKMVVKLMSTSVLENCYRFHGSSTQALVRAIVNDPDELRSHVQFNVASNMIRSTYGYTIKSLDDPILRAISVTSNNFFISTEFGKHLVDIFPFLRHLPEWMPGMGFFQTAEKMRKEFVTGIELPYTWTKDNLHTSASPNAIETLINELGREATSEEEEHFKLIGLDIVGAGMDTTLSSILTFFLAMILYPEVQTKARAEIDSVIGQDRLPTLDDVNNMPYIRSLYTEVHRWQPVGPLGSAHSLAQDDVYEGHFLPKGTLILPNVWHMLHDPEIYEDPWTFRPERYKNLDSEMQGVTDLAFGFGRRVCPGQKIAAAAIYPVILTTLAVCEILPPLNSEGIPVLPEVVYTSGVVPTPEKFGLRLKYRSGGSEELFIGESMFGERFI